MKIKCANCHFETEYSGNQAGATIPCGSCGKPVNTPPAIPEPVESSSPPPLDPSPSSQASPTTPPLPKNGRQIASSVLETGALFARRIFRSNLHSERVSKHEVEILETATPPISSPITQSYLGWRRALLWFGGVCLAIAALLEIPYLVDLMDNRKQHGIVKFVSAIIITSKIGAALLAILAAIHWSRVLRTRSMARLSWVCLFFIPLFVGFIPMAYFIDLKKTGIDPAMASVAFGLIYFGLLTPVLLGLFPGIVRSALTLKTMLPESQMPGWVALIVAPLYALFLCIGLVIAAQAQDFLISATFIAFIAAPLIVIFNGRRLVAPADSEQMMRNITVIKRQLGLAYGIGVALAILVAFRFLGKVDVSFFDVTGFISSLLANLFLVTVVVSDLLLTLFKEAYTREISLREEGLLESLEERFHDLDEIGLTQLKAGELELVKGLGNRLKQISGNNEEPPT